MKCVFRPVVFQIRRLILITNLFRDYTGDALQFVRWSHDGIRDLTKGKMESSIIKSYHGFEKGLSLESPRIGFGQENARRLLDKISKWKLRYAPNQMTQAAESSLQAYYKFNKEAGLSLDFMNEWIQMEDDRIMPETGGVKIIKKSEVLKAIQDVSEKFFISRNSMRIFSREEVPLDDIKRAVSIAQKSPSVCNRQGVRIYCAKNAMDALKWQPGNRGFGHLAGSVAQIS